MLHPIAMLDRTYHAEAPCVRRLLAFSGRQERVAFEHEPGAMPWDARSLDRKVDVRRGLAIGIGRRRDRPELDAAVGIHLDPAAQPPRMRTRRWCIVSSGCIRVIREHDHVVLLRAAVPTKVAAVNV